MTRMSSDGPSTNKDLGRPVAWGMIWKRGSQGVMPFSTQSRSIDKLMGEDPDRSK